jgi:hypothetical protein
VLCRARTEINGAPGDLISLVPWGGPAEGVRTDGLRWALRGETLLPERSRGISNEMLGDTARVFVEYGSVLVIHRRWVACPRERVGIWATALAVVSCCPALLTAGSVVLCVT